MKKLINSANSLAADAQAGKVGLVPGAPVDTPAPRWGR